VKLYRFFVKNASNSNEMIEQRKLWLANTLRYFFLFRMHDLEKISVFIFAYI
jgi:hypothetical protein